MGSYFSKKLPDEAVDDVIIGSGIGGMVLAGILSTFGRRVCVLEQHYVPGGATHSFRRPGYRWNVGVHVVGDVAPDSIGGAVLGELCEKPIQWNSLGPHYDQIEFPQDRFQVPSSEESFKQSLIQRFPEEKAAIETYFEMVHRACFVSLLHFIYKALPWHGKWATWYWMKRPSREYTLQTTQEAIASVTSNQELRRLLSAQWGYYGTPPSESSFVAHAQVTAHFFKGGYYPEGGANTFAERILAPVVRRGGSVAIRARVKKILFNGRRATGVELEDGRVLGAKRIFSDAGAHATSRFFKHESRFAPWVEKVSALPTSYGHLALFLGFDCSPDELGLGSKNLWSYAEEMRPDVGVEMPDYPESEYKPQGFWFSLESAKDPSHEGSGFAHCAQVITFVPTEWFSPYFRSKRGQRGEDYEALKARLKEGLLASLCARYPQVKKHIVHSELSTPASTHTFTARPEGSIYSLAATPERFWAPYLGSRTPSKNVFLAGADSAMVGLIGALAGGVLAAFASTPWRSIRFLFRAMRRGRKITADSLRLSGDS